jgi:tetratricopeptide (TPR) repeat protein
MRFLLIIAVLSGLSACSYFQVSKNIAQKSDYQVFMTNNQKDKNPLSDSDKEMAFWQTKLQKDPSNNVFLLQMAYLKIGRFKLTGQVEELFQADSILHLTNRLLNDKERNIYYTLVQNSITQHQFKKAHNYLIINQEKNGKDKIADFLAFDVAMELGKYDLAKMYLKTFKNEKSFDYLIRLSKYQDYEGHLESAILTMEKAFHLIETTPKKSLYCWALSNLAEMYGHAGRIQESYQTYLRVLAKDPHYMYALKGIAWIAFSHDKNTAEAKEIYQYLANASLLPDYYLNLAEIADYEGDIKTKSALLKKFQQAAEQAKYGEMYNKYLILLYADELNQPEKALLLAQKEVKNRPTAETYNLLAWAYLKLGKKALALEIAQKHLIGKTFEPEVMYHLAHIYEANGWKQEAKKYMAEAAEAKFELGPTVKYTF